MNKRRKFTALLGILICVALLMSCKKNDTGEETYELYYVNVQTQALEQEEVQIEGDTTEEKIESMLKELKKNPEDVEVKETVETAEQAESASPEKSEVEKWELTNGRLGISFNQEYKNVKKVPELLFRASLVQSLIQIDGVDSVKFYIGGDPLCDANGNEIGAMNDEYFVQNIGSTLHTYQSVDLELYFANSEGDKLVTETEHVRYNSNTLKEKLIVEELMKGPSAETYKKVIPMDTVLLGVSVKDDVCYVNFDNGFLNMTDIQPEVTIYSIVNSIIRGGSASKVQILVNGDSNLKYQEQVDLSQPLTEREDIVED